ncbi:YqgE/AlgH family protein [Pseudidiomarina insulisalsae]|uniref:UPF0301 protein CWI71_09715 n=1 Tax=Pseudidiomarina insulisalsae TaxID=575789 RepID=A0A432YCP8_9GAMM|nr:YqgE/AlgH family protein [Pseudidiomarina insulisalsae]RUO58785.1 YqgE/AlgH family protein [Pseudidiomarina insulisalsae]
MTNLQNHFLIAMPDMEDPFFHRSVTYICEHNEDGAMGLIINNPVELNVAKVLEQLEIVVPERSVMYDKPVFAGGPLARDRGFVLHAPSAKWNSSAQLSDEVMITTSKDILEAMGRNEAPEKFILTLGYAGWESGQLEQELAENSWLTIPADADILFNTPSSERWQRATEKLGFQSWQLGPGAGHA